MSRSILRRRAFTATVSVALALSMFGALSAHRASAGQYSQGNSSCTSREDPANILVDYIKLIYYPLWAPGARFDYSSGHTGGYAAAALSRSLWSGGLGSSDSWYNFGSNGGCVDQADYATNSVTSGHHVRYWMSAVGTRPAGAAHHDFLCGIGHSADQFIDSSTNVASFMTNIYHPPYASWKLNQDRSPSSFNKCGEIVPDDGWTNEIDFTYVPTFSWTGN
jgi:hypothetical protein